MRKKKRKYVRKVPLPVDTISPSIQQDEKVSQPERPYKIVAGLRYIIQE